MTHHSFGMLLLPFLYADFALVIAQAPGVEILFSSQIQNGSQIKCFEVFEPFFPPSAFALNLRGQLLLGLESASFNALNRGNVMTIPIIVGGEKQVVIPNPLGNHVYRLRKP